MKTVLPTWLGSYFGSDKTFEEYEYALLDRFLEPIRARYIISRDDTRWFDYRRLHPLQATYYFVDCYRKIYASYSKKRFGKLSRGYRVEDFLQTREASSFWIVRAYCDGLGVPYPWFIYKIFDILLDTGRFKNHLPRPQHLMMGSHEESLAIKDAWKAHLDSGVFMMGTDPYLMVGNSGGTLQQIAHEKFLLDQVARRTTKHFLLATLVYDKQMVRIESVIERFPDELDDMFYDAECKNWTI